MERSKPFYLRISFSVVFRTYQPYKSIVISKANLYIRTFVGVLIFQIQLSLSKAPDAFWILRQSSLSITSKVIVARADHFYVVGCQNRIKNGRVMLARLRIVLRVR